jgi:hypothetical protein
VQAARLREAGLRGREASGSGANSDAAKRARSRSAARTRVAFSIVALPHTPQLLLA